MELLAIQNFLQALRPFRALPPCSHCEPLQAAFARLSIELSGTSASPEKQRLGRELRDCLDARERLHPRLDCGDCPPARLLDRIRQGTV